MRTTPIRRDAPASARLRIALLQLVVALLGVALVDYAFEAIVLTEQLVRISAGAIR